MNKKIATEVAIGAIIIITIIIGGYFWPQGQLKFESSEIPIQDEFKNQNRPMPSQEITKKDDQISATSDWQTYQNEEFRFKFAYPSNLKYEIVDKNLTDGENWIYFVPVENKKVDAIGKISIK